MKRYLPFLPRIINRRGLPIHLIYFVTGRCNLKCEHCFYWKELNQGKNELTLDEVEKISRSMDPLLWLALTGGEPFLRPDLPAIARTFVKNTFVRHISIPTNGFFTENIVDSVNQMLNDNPATTFSITVSCDGLEEMHDKIRGIPGSFKSLVRTVKELKRLKKRHANLGVGMTMTFTATNQHHFLDIYRHLRDEVRPDEIVFNLIRGLPKNPVTANIDLKLYRQAVKQKLTDLKTGKLPYYRFGLMGKLAAARDVVMYDRIVKYKEGRGKYTPCLAGRLSAVMDEAGVVYPCELLSFKLGNIRDFNYRWPELWETPEADEIRRWIWDTHCACTHECFLTTNIFFSPRSYTELLTQLVPFHVHR